MNIILILVGALFTLVVGIVSVVSETFKNSELDVDVKPEKQLTKQGWAVIICLCLGAIVTAAAGIVQNIESKKTDERARQTLEKSKQIYEQNKATLITTRNISVATWRDNRDIEASSGYVTYSLALVGDDTQSELGDWLSRVTGRYKDIKASVLSLPFQDFNLSDKFGKEYILISSKENRDLMPDVNNEKNANQLFFNARYAVMVSSPGSGGGLLVPSFLFNVSSDNVRVYFDPQSGRPIGIEGSASGEGRFNSVGGQFTNWIDFYGKNIIVRLLTAPKPDIYSEMRIDYFTIDTNSNKWSAAARFPVYEQNVTADNPGTLNIVEADWNTLGSVPNNFPGERKAEYGPLKKEQ